MPTPHIHCLTSLKVAGTGSFRLASGQFLGNYGANLQNPDKEALDIYIAPPGMSFVQCDQSGAEALIVAYLTRPANTESSLAWASSLIPSSRCISSARVCKTNGLSLAKVRAIGNLYRLAS